MPKVVLRVDNIQGVYNWEVIDLFKEFGPSWVDIRKRNAFCYVTFYEAEDAYYTQKELDGYAFGHQYLSVKVHWEQPKKECKFFSKHGHCKFGDKCKQVHLKKCEKCNKKLGSPDSAYCSSECFETDSMWSKMSFASGDTHQH